MSRIDFSSVNRKDDVRTNLPLNITIKFKFSSMNLKVNQKDYDAIAREIHSDASPVGIDAKKTHIIIIQKLIEIEKRLEKLEKKLEKK